MPKYVHKKGDSPVFEIDSWKFQKMAYLEFSETSKNVSSFRHLFYSFQGGINDKMLKNYQNYTLVLDFFFGNYEKKLSKRVEILWGFLKF